MRYTAIVLTLAAAAFAAPVAISEGNDALLVDDLV